MARSRPGGTAWRLKDHPVEGWHLGNLGLSVVAHATGERVAEKTAAVKPDVILPNLLLPDISGWDVLAQLKADPRT